MILNTLVVTTYNRAALLTRVLESIAASGVDWARHEVVVVDNNSSDGTAQASRGFAEAHPTLPLRYLFEPRQGLLHARNAGLAAAQAWHIAFMDDDQQIDPNCLHALPMALARTGAACLGGRIFYRNAHDLPVWLVPLVDRIAQIDLGGSEEDAVQDLLRAQGKTIACCPELVRFNVLLPKKLRKRCWRAQAYGGGHSEFQRSQVLWSSAQAWAGAPRALFRTLLQSAGQCAAAALAGDGVRCFQRERDVWGCPGSMAEARAMAARRRRPPTAQP